MLFVTSPWKRKGRGVVQVQSDIPHNGRRKPVGTRAALKEGWIL